VATGPVCAAVIPKRMVSAVTPTSLAVSGSSAAVVGVGALGGAAGGLVAPAAGGLVGAAVGCGVGAAHAVSTRVALTRRLVILNSCFCTFIVLLQENIDSQVA